MQAHWFVLAEFTTIQPFTSIIQQGLAILTFHFIRSMFGFAIYHYHFFNTDFFSGYSFPQHACPPKRRSWIDIVGYHIYIYIVLDRQHFVGQFL